MEPTNKEITEAVAKHILKYWVPVRYWDGEVCDTATTPEELLEHFIYIEEATSDLEATNQELVEALELIQTDMHQFSKRPCPTCKRISLIMDKDFGCVAKAKEGKR